ncbi:unnamed protein product [Soboliphyme baturini]|uniref:Micronuclear linker histone polyprotein-like n=1 Tax=Soboliphyme baturini TaxID=241478 RepID=A0A183I9Q2_9BILA|nr:unnamed protein product [Soboliphyme baturini]
MLCAVVVLFLLFLYLLYFHHSSLRAGQDGIQVIQFLENIIFQAIDAQKRRDSDKSKGSTVAETKENKTAEKTVRNRHVEAKELRSEDRQRAKQQDRATKTTEVSKSTSIQNLKVTRLKDEKHQHRKKARKIQSAEKEMNGTTETLPNKSKIKADTKSAGKVPRTSKALKAERGVLLKERIHGKGRNERKSKAVPSLRKLEKHKEVSEKEEKVKEVGKLASDKSWAMKKSVTREAVTKKTPEDILGELAKKEIAETESQKRPTNSYIWLRAMAHRRRSPDRRSEKSVPSANSISSTAAVTSSAIRKVRNLSRKMKNKSQRVKGFVKSLVSRKSQSKAGLNQSKSLPEAVSKTGSRKMVKPPSRLHEKPLKGRMKSSVKKRHVRKKYTERKQLTAEKTYNKMHATKGESQLSSSRKRRSDDTTMEEGSSTKVRKLTESADAQKSSESEVKLHETTPVMAANKKYKPEKAQAVSYPRSWSQSSDERETGKEKEPAKVAKRSRIFISRKDGTTSELTQLSNTELEEVLSDSAIERLFEFVKKRHRRKETIKAESRTTSEGNEEGCKNHMETKNVNNSSENDEGLGTAVKTGKLTLHHDQKDETDEKSQNEEPTLCYL